MHKKIKQNNKRIIVADVAVVVSPTADTELFVTADVSCVLLSLHL
jgi:hypothetical protein